MASAAPSPALAHDHYDKAQAILAKKPKGRIATPWLMGAVYSRNSQSHRSSRASRRRASASRCRKGKLLSLVLRAGFG